MVVQVSMQQQFSQSAQKSLHLLCKCDTEMQVGAGFPDRQLLPECVALKFVDVAYHMVLICLRCCPWLDAMFADLLALVKALMQLPQVLLLRQIATQKEYELSSFECELPWQVFPPSAHVCNMVPMKGCSHIGSLLKPAMLQHCFYIGGAHMLHGQCWRHCYTSRTEMFQ